MKRLFILFAVVVFCGVGCTEVDMNESIENGTTSELPNADEIPNNQIWYTTTDGEAIDISLALWDEITNISAISNVYENGRGVLTFNGDVTTIRDNAFAFNSGMLTLKGVVMPKTVRHIKHAAFAGCANLESITFSRDLLTIDDSAFFGCSSIKSLDFPERLYTIGEMAFYDCSSIEEIILPESLKSIGNYAFSSCSLRSVTIPEGVETINTAAFTSPYLEEFKGKYASEDGRCLIVDGVLNSFAPAGLTEYITPNSATVIGDSAFGGCRNLTNITISEGVTSIGNSAFSACDGLTSITIPDSVTEIGSNPFRCANIREFSGKFATDGGRALIANDIFVAYAQASGGSYTIPDGVTKIGGSAFEFCANLTDIVICDGVTEIGDSAFLLSGIKSLTIPDSVNSIGFQTFMRCESLENITFGAGLQTIGEVAFADCYSLKSVTLPDSVEVLDSWAFCGCFELETVSIGAGLIHCGEGAFIHCNKLSNVYCKAQTPPLAYLSNGFEWTAFDYNAEGRKIYVPVESVESYRDADGWRNYASDIEGYNF